MYRFVAPRGRVQRLEQHIIPTHGTVMSMSSNGTDAERQRGVRIFIDYLGGVFRLFLKQVLYESVLVAFIVVVFPSNRSSLFGGSEHPG